MEIIWLASYPKSGNTYMRMLLHTYLYGESQDTGEISKYFPDLHQHLSKSRNLVQYEDKPIIVKTHFCYSSHHPYYEKTIGFIYIVRNPRDVLIGWTKFWLGIQISWLLSNK